MAVTITLDSVVRVSDDVLFQDLHGEAVLLNLKTGVYFGLDAIGARVWELLAADGRLATILEALTAEYDVSRERGAEDLLALAAKLEEHGLIVLS
jgi:hypothetical protein